MNKIRNLREELVATGSPGIVVSMLDEVAWMFNLRGSDISYNPVSNSTCVVLQPKDSAPGLLLLRDSYQTRLHVVRSSLRHHT